MRTLLTFFKACSTFFLNYFQRVSRIHDVYKRLNKETAAFLILLIFCAWVMLKDQSYLCKLPDSNHGSNVKLHRRNTKQNFHVLHRMVFFISHISLLTSLLKQILLNSSNDPRSRRMQALPPSRVIETTKISYKRSNIPIEKLSMWWDIYLVEVLPARTSTSSDWESGLRIGW